MGKHEVYIPETLRPSRRKMTAEQWLAECEIRGGKTRVFDLPSPIVITYVESDEKTIHTKTVHKSNVFFRALRAIAEDGDMIAALYWQSGYLGAHGLYLLNQALRTFPLRKGGRNVVRHWMDKVAGIRSPLRSDVARLFSYLEIRPVFTHQPAPIDTPAKYYVYSTSKHKAVAESGHILPRHAKK